MSDTRSEHRDGARGDCSALLMRLSRSSCRATFHSTFLDIVVLYRGCRSHLYRTQSCVIPSLRTMSRNAPAHEDRDVNQSPRPPSIFFSMMMVESSLASCSWDQPKPPCGTMHLQFLDVE